MNKKDQSYGIIPLCRKGDSWQVFLVQLHAGHWGFPKGHPEGEESPWESAVRELAEETGLEVVRRMTEVQFEEQYTFEEDGVKYDKTVHYFPAEVEGVVVTQEEEVADSGWFPVEEMEGIVGFAEGKKLCRDVLEWLRFV